ncbi:hypothetical protein [Corynebacterium terpenotabidum]|uniref:Uncharacterized protein n=1 Tax=Corynebacterium terpenotabidum Y-11 TaxID=1200352 RepID=S4XJ45_9CORY|nr:hypothetical protein [Corynebacterium terpenotabidum]AGP30613.1 hypothetical protein A606_04820 [Corynebacterium terpenotabidum Y-11]
MDPSLHLRPLPTITTGPHPADIYATGTPLLIPLGAGVVTTIHQTTGNGSSTELTTDDLVTRDTTVGGLWADAALTMLATLGRLTAVHGTALRRRYLTDGLWEVGVIDDPFPAAGLIGHPLLIRPTLRILQDTPQVSVTAGGRLLVLEDDAPPPSLDRVLAGETCSPVLTLTDGALQ